MSSRGVSSLVSAIVVVIVLAGVGVGTYGVMGGFTKGSPKTCEPVTSPICGNYVNTHDVSLLLPFKSVQQGAGVPFTVSLPAGEASTSYTVYFGDGTQNSSRSSLISHNYSTPGTYLVRATASVNGQAHDNVGSLVLLTVTPSFAANQIGAVPSVAGSVLGNTTVPSGTAVTAVLQTGQSVTLTGSYTGQPTNPAFVALPPKMVSTGGTLSAITTTNTSLTDQATFSTPGTYTVSFVGAATNGTIGTGGNVTGGATLYMNYTWTVYVAAAGEHAGIQGSIVHHSPHPGIIINYELAPGGALSEDPAIDYETVGAEPIINVYQTLITYNGSLTGPEPTNYVPVLATCVPGSAQCQRMYGDSLVDGWNYTFVIQGNASFYDPLTGAHWGVWPTDVVFSLARTMGFSTLPSTESNNGWIVAQSLLDSGNVTWDSIHGSYNNTPSQILNSMSINETTLPGGGQGPCPTAAMSGPDHGCVTFHVYGQHHAWPYFLELIADPLGGSVVPCGWFSSPNQAAGIPYWTRGNVSGSGDIPCAAPGAPGWGLAANDPRLPATGWDQWEQL
ncbi:MAG TPA: PKD domain-containing protein, partial [Thermoplasmata archaeon]|nr:PKD domain-containing protein [Thermoplasmata archaeon]